MINIKNYTSIVPADQSILQIERKLVEFGAMDIMKKYNDGQVQSLSFRIIQNGQPLSFQLPVKIEPVIALFKKAAKNSLTAKQLDTIRQQATRTAWKNMHDWIIIQLTMIHLEQLDPVEVFMSQMLTAPGQTLYEKMKETEFKALN